ncbi:MAG TPA: hypothetical protein VFC38_01385 [Stellaceae bacterium]|nr:hypothetical protein [Stellaceae bacterium]
MAVKLPTKKEVDYATSILQKHAAYIGRIAIEWNSLHHTLGELFVEVLAPDQQSAILAAWHAVPSDRSKRDMLKAAARAALSADSRFCDELEWACGQINALEDNRNNAIHSPYALLLENGDLKFVPNLFSGSSRARKLRDKNLQLEFESYAKNIHTINWWLKILRGLVEASAEDQAWPERPALPRTAQASGRRS